MKTVALSGGTIEYDDRGSGPPVVFVHGLLANGNLWRKVVPLVADAASRRRCRSAPTRCRWHRMRT